MQISVKLKGIEKIRERVSKTTLKEVIHKALKRATLRYHEMIHDWIDTGKSFTPRTGFLQQSIIFDLKSWHTGVIRAEAPYASFVEYGTKPHKILPKNKKALRFIKDGEEIIVKKVNHPGSKAYPFFFADMENRKREVQKAFREDLEEWLSMLS